MEETRNKIVTIKTDKRLCEFSDKLNEASVQCYGNVFAGASSNADGGKTYSKIGVLLYDYSQGKGEAAKRATANFEVIEVKYIANKIRLGLDPNFVTKKVLTGPGPDGYAPVTVLRVKKTEKDKDGNPMRYPFTISIENGKGIPVKTEMGGSYAKPGSYVAETSLSMQFSEGDMFKLFETTDMFIDAFIQAYCVPVIRKGHELYGDERDAAIAAKNNF